MNLKISVWRDVDVLVVGATTAAVTATLGAKAAGGSVALAGDLPYFGEDLAGCLNLWPQHLDLRDPLMKSAFGTSGDATVRPGALKAVLEEALLEQEIPFLHMVRPVAVLRDGKGGVCGAVFAARTALFAIRCRCLIDASSHGLVARLAGVPFTEGHARGSTVTWTVLGTDAPRHWPGTVEVVEPGYRQIMRDGTMKDFGTFRLSLPYPGEEVRADALMHELRSHLVEDGISHVAEFPMHVPDRHWQVEGAHALPGLVLASPGLPGLRSGVVVDPGVLAARGREAGLLAAEEARAAAPGPACIFDAGEGGRTGEFHFTEPFLREACGTIEGPLSAFPVLGRFDVVVAGGGTGGAPAGIAAAREGASALVVEHQRGLGGVGTTGLISSYWFGNKVGFTAELDTTLASRDTLAESKKGNMWNPVAKSGLYHRMLREAGGTAWLGGHVFGVHMDRGRVTGLLVSTPYGSGLVEAGCVVDATGNADVAAAAGAPCRLMDERHVAVQGTGLSPVVHPGVLHQNSDHTFIEENDPEGLTLARAHARRKFATDFDTASLVDSRERRQILGEIEVSPLDLLAGRIYPDTVFTARSNFDTHGFIIHPVFMICPPNHQPLKAHVPFRAMLPRGIEGVLVTGLGMSAHRDALPVIRMQADVQNQGYVAGLAAVESVRRGCGLRGLDLPGLQRRLVALGILAPEVAGAGDTFPIPREEVLRAAEDPMQVRHVAILMAHPEESRGPLQLLLQREPQSERGEQAALILGFQGCVEAAPALTAWLEERTWDEGWNYRGMGQFGSSMSRMDAVLMALARCGDAAAVPAVERKIRALGADADFSHCRAVAVAAAALAHPALGSALSDLLRLPTLSGHAQHTAAEVRRTLNDDPVETEARNLSLRELHLARGLYLAGDVDGLGASILEAYSRDLRGHYALHARAVLRIRPGGLPVQEIA